MSQCEKRKIPLLNYIIHVIPSLSIYPQLLLSGGVEAQLYNIDDKVLVNMERHLLPDAQEFLLGQPEVDFLTIDQKPVYPKGRRAKK